MPCEVAVFLGEEVGFQHLALMPLPDLHLLPEQMNLQLAAALPCLQGAPGHVGFGLAFCDRGFRDDFLLCDLALRHQAFCLFDGRQAGKVYAGEARLNVLGFRAVDLTRKAVHVAGTINQDKGPAIAAPA